VKPKRDDFGVVKGEKEYLMDGGGERWSERRAGGEGSSDEKVEEVAIVEKEKKTKRVSLSRLSKIAVMVKSLVYLIIRDSQAHKFSK
jgi:hypothetical protein